VHTEVARLGINGAASKREGQSRENAERLHGRILSMSISLTRNKTYLRLWQSERLKLI
jgi:hypothetical protein